MSSGVGVSVESKSGRCDATPLDNDHAFNKPLK